MLVRCYRVTIETGKQSMEHLDSTVHINIFGNKGDTGVRSLRKKGAFSRGKVRFFLPVIIKFACLMSEVTDFRHIFPSARMVQVLLLLLLP